MVFQIKRLSLQSILSTLTIISLIFGTHLGATDRAGIALDSATFIGQNKESGPWNEGPGVIKFSQPIDASSIASLEEGGVEIWSYLPWDALLVSDGHKAQEIISPNDEEVWFSSWLPEFKFPRGWKEAVRTLKEPSEESSKQVILLHLFPSASPETLASESGPLGDTVVGSTSRTRFPRLRLVVSGAEIFRLQSVVETSPAIFFAELERGRVPLNDTTIWVGQSGTGGGQATPVFAQGLHGEGQIVGVLDTGIDPDMCFFRDLSLGLPPTNLCNSGTTIDAGQRKVLATNFLDSGECSGGISGSEWDTHGHGTHVAGTVAGDDFATVVDHDAGDGMAPAAKLVIQDAGFGSDSCADLPGLGCPVVDLVPIFQQAYDQGVRIHTNSWGDQENAFPSNIYSAGSEDADEFMWNHPDFLLLFAAGNSGPASTTVLSPSTAKNVVSVGATRRGSLAENMAGFSSCGPTDDGRIKPDLTIPGRQIVSASADGSIVSNNCTTTSMSGTSMASPAAAGLAALVRQYFMEGWYPSGAPQAGDILQPSGALVKVALLNSTTDMTGVSAIPDDCQGWGRIQLDRVLHFSGGDRKLWIQDHDVGFPQGSSGELISWSFEVTDSAEPLRVTLGWTDFPSTPAASVDLVNDLDLEVTGPGGLWLGNVFSGGFSVTGGSADRLNTVEQVYLETPTPGTYTVSVRSFTVPMGPQAFAVVGSGSLELSLFSDGFESGDVSAWSSAQN